MLYLKQVFQLFGVWLCVVGHLGVVDFKRFRPWWYLIFGLWFGLTTPKGFWFLLILVFSFIQVRVVVRLVAGVTVVLARHLCLHCTGIELLFFHEFGDTNDLACLHLQAVLSGVEEFCHEAVIFDFRTGSSSPEAGTVVVEWFGDNGVDLFSLLAFFTDQLDI